MQVGNNSLLAVCPQHPHSALSSFLLGSNLLHSSTSLPLVAVANTLSVLTVGPN